MLDFVTQANRWNRTQEQLSVVHITRCGAKETWDTRRKVNAGVSGGVMFVVTCCGVVVEESQASGSVLSLVARRFE